MLFLLSEVFFNIVSKKNHLINSNDLYIVIVVQFMHAFIYLISCMDKLSIANVVDFRNRSAASQVTLINNLKKTKDPEKKEEGGNYWVSCLSAIKNSLKQDSSIPIEEKIVKLEETLETEDKHINKVRWQRNLDILHRFEDYDFSQLQPKTEFTILKGLDEKAPLIIQGLAIKITPDYIVSFKENGIKKIGAVLFVGKIKQFKKEDLALFNDALYRYVSKNKGEDFQISKQLCVVVDFMNLNILKYSDLSSGKISSKLDATLKDIKKLTG